MKKYFVKHIRFNQPKLLILTVFLVLEFIYFKSKVEKSTESLKFGRKIFFMQNTFKNPIVPYLVKKINLWILTTKSMCWTCTF